MSVNLNEYLNRIPHNYRINLVLLEPFKGNRTLVQFNFQCGCETKQSLKAILKLKDFQYCIYCKAKYCEKFICTYCKKEFIDQDWYNECINNCRDKYENLVENVDFVICKICNFHGKSLGIHLKNTHNISSKDYIEKYNNDVLCENSQKIYSDANKENSLKFLRLAKENGVDLTEYWKKVSDGVREAILSNPNEIIRRSKQMIELNKIQQNDPKFQKIVSDTAKLTSIRPEILEARAKQLKKWRDDNPEDFYNKCVNPMLNSFQSKPERILFEYVTKLNGFSFKRNQRLKSNLFLSATKEKQIDMCDKDKRIYIEFDGPLHFIPKLGANILQNNYEKDKLLNEHILNHNWTLIRISYDQFIYSSKMINKIKTDASYFKQECLDNLVNLLNGRITGVYKIGNAYGKY